MLQDMTTLNLKLWKMSSIDAKVLQLLFTCAFVILVDQAPFQIPIAHFDENRTTTGLFHPHTTNIFK